MSEARSQRQRLRDFLGLEVKAVAITVIILVIVFEYFQLVLGAGITDSSVVVLEQELIQISGFLLAFTGVAYASIFTQLSSKGPLAKNLRVRLGIGAIGAFVYLFFALALSSWTLVIASNLDPKALYPFAVAFVLPIGVLAAAFVLIMVAMWHLTVTTTRSN
jgi:hypothetical protein